MMRWLMRGVLGLVAFAGLSYVVDYLAYRAMGSPKSQYLVSHFVSAPLKNNKEEIDFTGKDEEACSLTIYPQDGLTPCWYLKRHTNEVSSY